MEESKKNFEISLKSLQIADHLTYITFPIINDKRLLLKIFNEIYKSIIYSINSVLSYENKKNKIPIYKEDLKNLKTFITQFAKNYGLTNIQIKKIQEIIELNKKHKESAMEFVKKEKIIILSDELEIKSLDIYKIKEQLLIAKELLQKITKNNLA